MMRVKYNSCELCESRLSRVLLQVVKEREDVNVSEYLQICGLWM